MKRLPTNIITPVAKPVDTFARPQAPAFQQAPTDGGPLRGLAEGLRKLSGEVRVDQDVEDRRVADERQAFGYGLNTNRKSWNEALDYAKKNDPDRFEQMSAENPHVKFGFQKAFLDGATVRYGAALNSAIAENPEFTDEQGITSNIFDAASPDSASGWVNEFTAQWMEDNGVNGVDVSMVQDVFVPRMNQYQASAVSTEVRARKEQYLTGLEESVGTRSTLAVHEAMTSIDWKNDTTAAQQLGVALEGIGNDANEHGLREWDKINKQQTQALITIAEATGDVRILDAVKFMKKSKGGGFVGDIPDVAAKVLKAKDNITTKERNEVTFKRQHEKYNYWETVTVPWAKETQGYTRQRAADAKKSGDRKEIVRTTYADLTVAIIADPTKNWRGDPNFIKLKDADPTKVSSLYSLQESIINGNETTVDNKHTFATLTEDLNTQGGAFKTERLTEALAAGHITRRTFSSMWDDHRQIIEERKDPFLGSGEFKSLYTGLVSAIKKNVEGKESGGSAFDAGLVGARFRRDARVWRKKNPDGDQDDFMIHMEDIAQKMVKANPDAAAESAGAAAKTWASKKVFTSADALLRSVNSYRKDGSGTIAALIAMDPSIDPTALIMAQKKLFKGN